MLLKLNVALNLDCPELNLGTGWNVESMREMGSCPSYLKNVNKETFRIAYAHALYHNSLRKFYLFDSLRYMLGNKYCCSRCFSLSGYIYDFQLLIDRSGYVVPIPFEWKYCHWTQCGHSIGFDISNRNECLNLACDWGTKFHSKPAEAKVVMIEAIGRYHYAENVNHMLGLTRLKKHLSELMGWKVLSVRVVCIYNLIIL